MSAKQWRWTAWGLAAGMATLGTAWAQSPGGERTCGMSGTTAPAGRSRGSDEGRGSIAGFGRSRPDASAQLFSPVVEIPTAGSGSAVPAAPLGPGSTTTVASSSPPTPAPPPSLPGLTPPPTEKEREKDKDKDRARVEATQAKGEIPDERLLDVGVAVFDTGLTERDRGRLAAKGLSPELRKAEGRFLAFHLKKTMEGTGNWGAVRVLPAPAEGVDVLVTGKIAKSTGKDLELEVEAVDATGRRWLHKLYRGQADLSAYRPDRVGQYEPFQEVYNRIANDLLAKRDELEAAELVTMRRVAALRFANQLAPQAFTSYLGVERSGRYSLRRFPAEGDPMIRRVSDIRDRDQMFVDTLNDYYLSFYERMGTPYASWRHDSYEEQAALDKINRESKLKQILGGVAMIAGVVMSGSDSRGTGVAGDLVMLGGYAALEAGTRQAQEKTLHVAALKELANSFDGEVAPLLVEVEGHQLRLAGSAEQQFTEWRELLGKVFAIETGVPGDPNAPAVPLPPSI
jgi:hypothetical protein